MLNIKIICVGKIKEKSLQELINEYSKRLSKYCKLDIIELQDEKFGNNLSYLEAEKVKNIEGNKIKEKILKYEKATIFLLDLKGKEYSSEEFSEKLSQVATYENSTIIFVIGASLGISKEVLEMSNNKICFSKMTFPHQLIRVFLLEQIFRAFKIQNNEKYHH